MTRCIMVHIHRTYEMMTRHSRLNNESHYDTINVNYLYDISNNESQMYLSPLYV